MHPFRNTITLIDWEQQKQNKLIRHAEVVANLGPTSKIESVSKNERRLARLKKKKKRHSVLSQTFQIHDYFEENGVIL